METAAGENASQGEADDGDTTVRAFTRRKPKRAPLPADLPRERVVLPSPEACSCCGGGDLVKLGEDVTETLEVVPRQWKVVQTVREKFSCRACEAITQPPAPHHAIARGRAGPSLLAMIVCDKFAMRPAAHPAEPGLRGRRASRSTSRRWLTGWEGPVPRWRHYRSASGPMCSAPSGCTATTPRCRCWPGRRP